eukprot:6486792-Amphidinium_carterae.2
MTAKYYGYYTVTTEQAYGLRDSPQKLTPTTSLYIIEAAWGDSATNIPMRKVQARKTSSSWSTLTTIGQDNIHNFLKMQIEYHNNYIVMSMTKEYYESLWAFTYDPTQAHLQCIKRPPIDDLDYLTPVEHTTYRTAVGNLLWMCPLRPDIQYARKELTRALQKPNQHDQKHLKHLLEQDCTNCN